MVRLPSFSHSCKQTFKKTLHQNHQGPYDSGRYKKVRSTGSVKEQKESERKSISDKHPTIVQTTSRGISTWWSFANTIFCPYDHLYTVRSLSHNLFPYDLLRYDLLSCTQLKRGKRELIVVIMSTRGAAAWDAAPVRGWPAEARQERAGGELRQRHHLLQRHRRLHGHVCREHSASGIWCWNSWTHFYNYLVFVVDLIAWKRFPTPVPVWRVWPDHWGRRFT